MDGGARVGADDRAVGADTTDGDLRSPGVLRDDEGRHETSEPLDCLDPQLFERPAGKRGHRNGCRLDIGGARLRGGHGHSVGERADVKRKIQRRRDCDIDLAGARFKPAERSADHVSACGQRIELVSALLVGDESSRSDQCRAGDGHRDTWQRAASGVPNNAGELRNWLGHRRDGKREHTSAPQQDLQRLQQIDHAIIMN